MAPSTLSAAKTYEEECCGIIGGGGGVGVVAKYDVAIGEVGRPYVNTEDEETCSVDVFDLTFLDRCGVSGCYHG